MKNILLAVLVCVSVALCPAWLAARPGDLDPSFGTGGIALDAPGLYNNGYAVAVQPDGKIVAAGDTSDGPNSDIILMRYNPDGTLDTTFGENGITVYICPGSSSETVGQIALAVDGKIVVAGYTSGTIHDYDALLLRWNADGHLDETFGDGGVFIYNGPANGYDAFYDVAIQPDGKIVAVGETDQDPTEEANSDIFIVRLNDEGTPDTSFGANGVATYDDQLHSYDWGESVVIAPGGKIIVAGGVADGPVYDSTFVARYTANGVLDLSFGTGGVFIRDISEEGVSDYANAAALTPDGKILVTGGYIRAIDNSGLSSYLLQLNDNGVPDTSFGEDGIVRLEASELNNLYFPGLVVSPNGKILIAGHWTAYEGGMNATDIIVQRLDAQGNPDTTFGIEGTVIIDSQNSGTDYASDAAVQADGKIVLTGTLDTKFFVMRILASGQGEMSGDWEMNITDVILLLRMAAGMPVTIGGVDWAAPYSDELLSRADINADGVLNVFDVALAARMALQMPITIDGYTYEYPYPDL